MSRGKFGIWFGNGCIAVGLLLALLQWGYWMRNGVWHAMPARAALDGVLAPFGVAPVRLPEIYDWLLNQWTGWFLFAVGGLAVGRTLRSRLGPRP